MLREFFSGRYGQFQRLSVTQIMERDSWLKGIKNDLFQLDDDNAFSPLYENTLRKVSEIAVIEVTNTSYFVPENLVANPNNFVLAILDNGGDEVGSAQISESRNGNVLHSFIWNDASFRMLTVENVIAGVIAVGRYSQDPALSINFGNYANFDMQFFGGHIFGGNTNLSAEQILDEVAYLNWQITKAAQRDPVYQIWLANHQCERCGKVSSDFYSCDDVVICDPCQKARAIGEVEFLPTSPFYIEG